MLEVITVPDKRVKQKGIIQIETIWYLRYFYFFDTLMSDEVTPYNY